MAPAGIPNRPDWDLGERKRNLNPGHLFPVSLSLSRRRRRRIRRKVHSKLTQ